MSFRSECCSGISTRVHFAAVIWLIFPSVLHSCPPSVPLSVPLHCLHPSLWSLISPFFPIYFLAESGGAQRAWLQNISWTNRGHISLPGNRAPLWKYSVNYWPMNKHPLTHFWLSYCRQGQWLQCAVDICSGPSYLHLPEELRNLPEVTCCDCWIAMDMVSSLQMKNLNVNSACHLSDRFILFHFSVQTPP